MYAYFIHILQANVDTYLQCGGIYNSLITLLQIVHKV